MEQNLEDLKTWQDGARRKLENDIEQMKEELEQKLIEAENSEIIGIVRDADLSAEELFRVMAYAKKAMAMKQKEE